MTKAHKSVLDGVVETVVTGASLTVNNSDPKNPVINARIANQATSEAGTDNEQLMTALGVAQSIAKNSPPTDTSALALALADLQGSRLVMKGGVADAFDDESGVNVGINGGIDSFARLVLHGESLPVIDSSNYQLTLGQNTSVVSIDTTNFKFGSGSLRFPGTGNSFLTIPDEAIPEFANNDFTVDFWYRTSNVSTGNEVILTKRPTNGETSSFEIGRNGSGLQILMSSSTANGWDIIVSTAGTLIANTWHHVACVRNGTAIRMYLDGVQVAASTSSATAKNDSSQWLFGRFPDGTGQLNGWIDEFRISVGVARWTANFTPPTSPYTGSVGGSINQVYDATLDLYRPAQVGSTVIINNADGSGSGSATTVDRTSALLNSVTVQSVGLFSSFPISVTIKIVKENSDSNYDVILSQSLNHTGTGWLDVLLTSPFSVPSTGTYRIAVYTPSGVTYSTKASASRSIVAGDTPVSNGVSFSPGTGAVSPTRYSHSISYLNMNLISVNYATTTQPTYARLVLQIDTPLSIVPNTDLQGQVSRDGGITWATANLTLASTLGNIKTYQDDAVDLSGIGAGTNIVWRARTLTNKNIPISGVVTQWR